MRILMVLFLLCFTVQSAFANTLILEQKDEKYKDHGKHVQYMACGTELESCPLHYLEKDFLDDVGFDFKPLLDKTTTINMSFTFQKPIKPSLQFEAMYPVKYEKQLAIYKRDLVWFDKMRNDLEAIISWHPDTLFVAASGNGFHLGKSKFSMGVSLGEDHQVYPAVYSMDNVLTVSTITRQEGSLKIAEAELARYANFGLDSADVAARIGSDRAGKHHLGTSFAAPIVAKASSSLKKAYPDLSVMQRKEIIMKSCEVKAIGDAIKATLDLQENRKKSDVYRALHFPIRKTRLEELKSIGNILLVKSGGVFSPELAESCAKNLQKGNLSVQEACLEAHKEVLGATESDLDKLKTLWRVRNF